MDFLNIYQLNLHYFVIVSLAIVLMINKIFAQFLIKKNVYDLNEKNNGKLIYSGFGFSFTIITILYFILFLLFVDLDNIYYQIKYLPIPLSILIIGTIGFIDDWKGSPIHLRLGLFFMCCFLSTSSLMNNILPLIPFHKLQLIILTFFWVYLLNTSNFLDGGDKYYISFILPNFIFFSIYYYYFEFDLLRLQFSILILIFFFHFNFYNKDPNKFFLGDTGSLTFGYIYCFYIFDLIEKNDIILAILLSLFLLSDVSLTLFLRVINKKNIFTRHKGFLIHVSKYLGRSSKNISVSIMLTNCVLVILAIIYKLYFPNIMILILGILTIIIYLGYLIKFDLKNIKYTYLN
jgi:UDP-N-acetylmuramyl pentapeptide phosphotransferase/UDP-N-acetylglucosamine-1-phosphate transferase